MKNKEKQTKNTVKGNKRPLFGVKKVVDNDGSLSCFWYKDKLYDLNYNELADCKKVKTEEEGKAVNGFVRRGKYIHKDGNVVGKIKTDYSYILIAILFALLIVSVVALATVTKTKKEPLTGEITVVDTDGEWNAEGKINIFGNESIKPGDKGKYIFMVNNPFDVELKCKIEFIPNYENSEFLPPIRYSVSSEGQTLGRKETEKGFAIESVAIGKKGSRSFYVEWEWLFDGGTDSDDTLSGIAGNKYTVTIEITAEETK